MPSTDPAFHAPLVRAARASAWLAKQVELALQSVDLTPPQYRILTVLGSGSASATDAAERLAVSPPSVTAIVDGLVARSLVGRVHGEDDRRRVQLSLTAEGRAALENADEAVAGRLSELASHSEDPDHVDHAIESLGWWLDAIRSMGDARRASGR